MRILVRCARQRIYGSEWGEIGEDAISIMGTQKMSIFFMGLFGTEALEVKSKNEGWTGGDAASTCRDDGATIHIGKETGSASERRRHRPRNARLLAP